MNGKRGRTAALLFALALVAWSPLALAAKPENEVPGTGTLMPLRFTTFGDFYYLTSNSARDDFYIGTLELDVNLELSRYVDVSAGLTYDGASDRFGIGSFTIDCGIAGKKGRQLWRSDWIERSGIVFGKFDVPFGIAYLEYPITENRLILQPRAVLDTQGAWNDLGEQLYLQARAFSLIAFLVNASGVPGVPGVPGVRERDFDDAVGGRVALLPLSGLEFAVSGAVLESEREISRGLWGVDLHQSAKSVDVRLEFIENEQGGETRTRGAYARALYRLGPAFATARYGVVFDGDSLEDRELFAGAGAEVFPQGEIRVVHQRDFDQHVSAVFVELVGGSAWQPTGFRR